MIINYGNKDIIPFIKCNEYMHNQPTPAYLQSAQLGAMGGKTVYTLTPYKTRKEETTQELENTVKKGLFGKKTENQTVKLIQFVPEQESKGFSFISTENRNLTQTLCYIPVANDKYEPQLSTYKVHKLNDPKPSKYNPDRITYTQAQIGIHPELLMPMLSSQPKTLQDAINLVHTDPRFLIQIDPSICKNDDELELLYAEAKKGYKHVVGYQEELGVAPAQSDKQEAAEQEKFKQVCETYAKAFATEYLKRRENQSASDFS